ncbi:MAG: twin-arginine translocase TatA/TatE family subunit [Acidimicrobiia bacterium]|nr:twin-arginine translocase TatA/TatE family subunit [Acidimicrobiia bacterium]
MFSVSPAEILTIAVVALVVFGPKRLPELSRKLGGALRELKDTAADLRRGLESEIGGDTDLTVIRREMQGLLDIPPARNTPLPPRPPADPAAPSDTAP